MKRCWQFPALFTASVLLVVGIVDLTIVPFNRAGLHQWSTSWLAGLSRLLELPGFVLVQKLQPKVSHGIPLSTWGIMMAANVPIYLLAAVWVRWTWRKLRAGREETGIVEASNSELRSSRPGVSLPSRRQFIAAGNRVLFAGATAALGYSFFYEKERYVITRHTIPVRGLPPLLKGLKIAQLTDIHHGPWMPLSYVRRVVDATNALRPDLVALTGDYVSDSAEYIVPVVRELARLQGRIGVVGVMGNHDWWESSPQTERAFARVGIPLIDNRRLFISPDRILCDEPCDGLCVAGLADLWQGRPDYLRALGGLPADMPRLLLSHNPDTAEMAPARNRSYRVDLMLSGHTHGGQVWIPGLGTPIIPSSFGQKYAHGLVHGPGFRVFISSGIGTTCMPLRFGRPPEIALLTLV